MSVVLRECSRCHRSLPLSRYYRSVNGLGGYQGHCKSCQNDYTRDYNAKRRKADHRYRLYKSAYANARKHGLEHSVGVSDIGSPTHCAYLGIELDYAAVGTRAWNAPSIDRIDPSLGYIPGNVQVISELANRMKQNATVEQLLAFAHGVLRLHG